MIQLQTTGILQIFFKGHLYLITEHKAARINWVKKKSFYLDFDEQKDNECSSSLLIKLGGQLATFLSNKSDFIVRKSSKTKLKLFPRKNTILRQTRAMDLIVKSKKKEFERSSYTVEIAKKWNIKILIYEDTCQELKLRLKQWNKS